jgi:hypothetical protein
LGNPPRTVQLTNAPRSGMEDDEFGRCYVACTNRCADDRRRDRDMPWRPGATERGGLRPAERRPADVEPADWE